MVVIGWVGWSLSVAWLLVVRVLHVPHCLLIIKHAMLLVRWPLEVNWWVERSSKRALSDPVSCRVALVANRSVVISLAKRSVLFSSSVVSRSVPIKHYFLFWDSI